MSDGERQIGSTVDDEAVTGRALVVGGSGMLSGCTATLVADGWHVVTPSRRYGPIPDRDQAGARRALWVPADWNDPEAFTEGARDALGGAADLLVVWVHSSYRRAVLRALATLLRSSAPVIEVHGSAAADPLTGCPEPKLPGHPTQQVVLGFVRSGGRVRWLTNAEIADGVLAAVRRALSGRPPMLHQVGELRPWALHP
ncbi:MAG: hypothetical protein ACRDRN_17930 [Sciscionella sp.]